MEFVNHEQASLLLRDKYVVVLGDSIQRSVYKDLVLLLQKDKYLSLGQLKSKGELSFEQDRLVDGSPLHNGPGYREVREYLSHGHRHLVRFYFLTRIYSPYVQLILEHFHNSSLKPDVVIVNSCLWDITRYNNANWLEEYTVNLDRFFYGLTAVLPQESLVMWNLTMPVSQRNKAGFLRPVMAYRALQLDQDVIKANWFSWERAIAYGLDVLDLYTRFRLNLQQRMEDGVHWDHLAHRRITSLILQRAAEAWGVLSTDGYFSSDDFSSFGGIHGHGFHGNTGPPRLGPSGFPSAAGDYFSSDDFSSFGGIHGHGFHGNAGPPRLGPSGFPSAAGAEFVSPPVDFSSFSSFSLRSMDGTDGMGGGMGNFKSVSTSTRIVGGKCTPTQKIKENGAERTQIEENGVLKTVLINEPIKPKPKPSCGNGAQKAAKTYQTHYYDYEEFAEDSVTTNHEFIPGYMSFDGGEQPPPHPPHRPPQPPHYRPAHSMAAMYGVRYRPYSLPPHSYHITPASQEGRNEQYHSSSYVTRNRRTKRQRFKMQDGIPSLLGGNLNMSKT